MRKRLLAFTLMVLTVLAVQLWADGLGSYASVSARRQSGRVTIRITGTGDWRISSDFPLKLKVGTRTLTKEDGVYNFENAARKETGKATSATFEVDDASAATGTVTLAFKSASGNASSNAITGTFPIN